MEKLEHIGTINVIAKVIAARHSLDRKRFEANINDENKTYVLSRYQKNENNSTQIALLNIQGGKY